MRIRRRREEEESLPLTPLIDVVFLLLIFFLTATSFYKKERDIKVNPPRSTESKTPAQTKGEITVNVRNEEDGGLFVVNGQIKSLPDLTQLLSDAAQRNPDQVVIIRGDRRAIHQRIVDVLSACMKANIQSYYIGTTLEKAQGG
ncbi:MAG: ExbD/TolR family protein [Candidatus Brocadiia bacterium]